jgi:hypothetical protein
MSIQENTSELETLLEQINNLPEANTNHTHNDLYYTKAESDELFENKADAGHNHSDLYYTKTESDTLLNAKADEGHSHSEYRIKTYSSFTQINLTNGSETIDSIATNMSNYSMMITTIGASNAVIYPNQYGILEVIKAGDTTRVVFRFYNKSTAQSWFGVYDSGKTTKWTGWTEIGGGSGDYVPIDGSTSMSGNLTIERSGWMGVKLKNTTSGREGRIASSNNGDSVQVSKWADDNNLSYLNLNKETSTLNTILQLSVKKNGSTTNYDIFGEHNIDLLSSSLITTGAELTSGVSSLGKGKIHLVFEE